MTTLYCPAPRRSTLERMRDVVAIIRDLLIIALFASAFILGASILRAVDRELPPAVPAGSVLPVDRCGGGVCDPAMP